MKKNYKRERGVIQIPEYNNVLELGKFRNQTRCGGVEDVD